MTNNYKNTSIDHLKVAIGQVFDEFGGVSQHIFGIKKYSAHKVVVVPSKFSRTIIGKRGGRIWLYKKFMNKVGLSRYDIVHSHPDLWFINLCQASKTNSCKWVHTYHMFYFGEDYPEGLQPWQKEANRALIHVASKVDVSISVSKWLHDYLSENYSIQTEIIPNGFDLETCNRANPDRFTKKFGLRDFVLFTGSINPRKNPKLFVEQAVRMPELRFVMIGRKLDAHHLMKEYGVPIPKNLILLNEIGYEDVLDAVSACKVFVMTSKREGLPTALLEAMGMGKPVVAANVDGCNEAVQSKEYGFLYEPDSLDDLVEKTGQALVSKHIGKRARERVSRNYDWKILAKKIDSVYESLKG